MKDTWITGQSPVKGEEVPEEAEEREKPKERAFDLNVAQVLGSALAAVIAALIAGRLGVYGTIIGAGVISVVATTGGPVLQHLLRRTGQEVKEQVKQQVKLPPSRLPNAHRRRFEVGAHSGEAAVAPAGAERAPAGAGAWPDDRERVGGAQDPGLPSGATSTSPQPRPAGEFTTSRTLGTRWRGWRRLLLTSALVFVVAIGGITLYEALSGNNVSGGKGGTTSIGQILEGGSSGQVPEEPQEQHEGPGEGPNAPASEDPDSRSPQQDPGDTDPVLPTTPGGAEPAPDASDEASSQGDGSGEGQQEHPTPAPSPEHGATGGNQPEEGSAGGDATGGAERPEGGHDGGTERAPQQAPGQE